MAKKIFTKEDYYKMLDERLKSSIPLAEVPLKDKLKQVLGIRKQGQ